MERTVERYRKSTIILHWFMVIPFSLLLITGAIMFFDLSSIIGAQLVRTIHKMTAIFFIAGPAIYSMFSPSNVKDFLRGAFNWNKDDITWLKLSLKYYFGRKPSVPQQGYFNGDQKLWQLVIVVTGIIFVITGIALWFFKLKISVILYQVFLLTHATAFVIATIMFLVHFYLSTLHPRFEESLSSMVDGKISTPYAQEHFGKWHTSDQTDKE